MNSRRAAVKDIADGIRSQPGRVGLSFLAIAIGIASLTILVGMLNGLREKSRLMVRELGANVVAILRQSEGGDSGAPAGRTLYERHMDMLITNFPDCDVSAVRRYSVQASGANRMLTVLATDESLLRVRQWSMHSGRFLDGQDVRNRERHAVISRRLGEKWNWGVGDVMLLRNTPFRIVGIVEAGGSAIESELGDPGLMLGDRLVIVPRTVRPDWVPSGEKPGPVLDGIFMRVSGSRDCRKTTAQVQRLMSKDDYRVDGVSWVTPDSLVRGVRRLQITIQFTVGGISFLCLVLGGTTMMSLMVANVRSRFAEIGLRRALGATSRDIEMLFVTEAGAVTLLAGLAGMLLAHAMLFAARGQFSVPVRLGLASTVIPLFTAVALGAVFSYWPARWAAAIPPSETMRND